MSEDGAGVGGTVRANLELQRALYGELLGDRIRRLVNRCGVSQARIAEAVGISPTMLSQVMSGRRVKLANPAVVARLAVLERRTLVAQPDAAMLREVGGLSVADAVAEAAVADETTVVAGLRHRVDAAELLACAGVVRSISPALATLLVRAGS